MFEITLAIGASADPSLMKATVDAVGKYIGHIPDGSLWECARRIVANRVADSGYPDLPNVRDFIRAYGEIKGEEMAAEKGREIAGRAALAARLRASEPRPVRHISELAREASAIGRRPVAADAGKWSPSEPEWEEEGSDADAEAKAD